MSGAPAGGYEYNPTLNGTGAPYDLPRPTIQYPETETVQVFSGGPLVYPDHAGDVADSRPASALERFQLMPAWVSARNWQRFGYKVQAILGCVLTHEFEVVKEKVLNGQLLLLSPPDEEELYILQVAQGPASGVLRVFKNKWSSTTEAKLHAFLFAFAKLHGCSYVDFINSPRREIIP